MTKRYLTFGNKAVMTNWGLRSCSHGMYSGGGYSYYVYGIAGLFNYIVDESWGKFNK